MSAPSARSASTRSPIGRSCMRGDAVDLVVAAEHRERRRQRAHRRARVAEMQVAPTLTGNAPPAPVRRRTSLRAAIALDRDAERAQRVEHHGRVVGIEQTRRASVVPSRERGEQQHAVADALRARQRDHALARDAAGGERRGRAGTPSHGSALVARPSALAVPAHAPPRASLALARTRASSAAPSPRRDQRARPRRARRDSRRSRRSSASRLASAMSRHISGELAGDAREVAKAARRMREAARPRRAARRARRPARTRAGAAGARPRRRSHRGARRRACARARRRPPTARATRRDRVGARSPAAASGSTLRSSNSVGERRRRAGVLGAGDRMAGNEAAAASRRSAPRAARSTSCLVLPASVTTVRGPRCRAIAANSAGNCATGVATQHDVGVAQLARPGRVERQRAVDDAALERRRRGSRGVRPTPTTSPTAPAALAAPARTSRR